MKRKGVRLLPMLLRTWTCYVLYPCCHRIMELASIVKKDFTKNHVESEVEGVIRYKKNGKYTNLAPDGSIVSY